MEFVKQDVLSKFYNKEKSYTTDVDEKSLEKETRLVNTNMGTRCVSTSLFTDIKITSQGPLINVSIRLSLSLNVLTGK